MPFPEIFRVLTENRASGAGDLTAAIECGALDARLICLLSSEWWQGYPPRANESVLKGLQAARVRCLPDTAPYQTPWESNAPTAEIIAYEMEMARRSADNLRTLGLLKGVVKP
jgi:hypothetical protein